MSDESDIPERPERPMPRPPLGGAVPMTNPLGGGSTFSRVLKDIPPRPADAATDAANEIGNHATGEALKRSEARRDAVLAVALAIKRRGGNPLTDWTTKDTDTAYAIADQLAALG